ncbi:MAG: hypothetical protein EOO38_10510 [Cytophagaceae bacterium]|nr:MAG: hypothetical protein EOO38_10510 [Cytophagaceae bacterium]
MNFTRRLRIGARLATGFGLLLALITLISVVALQGNRTQNKELNKVVDVDQNMSFDFSEAIFFLILSSMT